MSADLRALERQPFDLLLQMEARLRAARLDMAAGQAETWSGLGFRVDNTWMAAPRDDVLEVIVPPPVTRVPNARPWMLGIANVRGNLLTVLDLRQFLGLPPAETQRGQRVLVLNSSRIPAGFLVDEVAGHRQFTPNEQRHSEAVKAEQYSSWLLGAFVRDGQPWLAMSLNKIALSTTIRQAGL
jgi:twitching motility protein PilI